MSRTEEDFLGKVEVPSDAYYGAFTVRAAATFKLSGLRVHPVLIQAVITIKKCAALANSELKTLDPGAAAPSSQSPSGLRDSRLGTAIVQAADEALSGKFDSEFILDGFQAGAGTPLHMNVNEVLANRATELLGGKKGEYMVHPNNHVNMAQSSNDVVPTAIRLACLKSANVLLIEIDALEKSLLKKSSEYKGIIKCGRTHLMDAVPISYGQVFEAYAIAIKKDRKELEHTLESLKDLGIGGTAVGTGINTHPKFKETIIKYLSKETGLNLRVAESSVETTHNMNAFLLLSSALRLYATTLNRIANDLRLLSSGPKTGIAEIILPEIEPGSSIMPGKVNPSVPESVNMVCYQVMGNDHTIELAANNGQLELNCMTPVIAYNLLQSLQFLENCSAMFREKCINGIKVDKERVKDNLDRSFAYATALNPHLGYSVVSKLVTEAYKKGIPLKKLILEKKLMDEKKLEEILSK